MIEMRAQRNPGWGNDNGNANTQAFRRPVML